MHMCSRRQAYHEGGFLRSIGPYGGHRYHKLLSHTLDGAREFLLLDLGDGIFIDGSDVVGRDIDRGLDEAGPLMLDPSDDSVVSTSVS